MTLAWAACGLGVTCANRLAPLHNGLGMCKMASSEDTPQIHLQILSQALNTIFGAIPSTCRRSGALIQQMLAFKSDHTIFDEELRPPIFRRDRPSHFPPTDPIPVVMNGALKGKENEEIGAERPVKRMKLDSKKKRKGGGITASKRKGDDDINDKKTAKRARTHQRKAQEGARKSANKQPASRPTTRRTRAGNR
ncbi:hypothetical protein DFH09DRAFT_1082408 [Mycena vulgaris]|nr:hypothetical protein DFH09DRAFT_1082408 [Mycena vulgaris]